jgi:hypothetical protein
MPLGLTSQASKIDRPAATSVVARPTPCLDLARLTKNGRGASAAPRPRIGRLLDEQYDRPIASRRFHPEVSIACVVTEHRPISSPHCL